MPSATAATATPANTPTGTPAPAPAAVPPPIHAPCAAHAAQALAANDVDALAYLPTNGSNGVPMNVHIAGLQLVYSYSLY